MTFQTDLQRGLEVEERVLAILQKKYPCATLVNAFKGYDIWIPEIDKSVEVKFDPMSQRTGNIVVEIEMYGKDSGLMATQADYSQIKKAFLVDKNTLFKYGKIL